MYVFEKLRKIVNQDHSQAGDALSNVLELHHHSEGGMCAECGGQEIDAECDTIQAIAAGYYPVSSNEPRREDPHGQGGEESPQQEGSSRY